MPPTLPDRTRVWPSSREMIAARLVMAATVTVLGAALLCGFETIFAIIAVLTLGNTCLIYRATRSKARLEQPTRPR